MPERTVENFGFKGPKPRTSNKKKFITPNSELRTCLGIFWKSYCKHRSPSYFALEMNLSSMEFNDLLNQ